MRKVVGRQAAQLAAFLVLVAYIGGCSTITPGDANPAPSIEGTTSPTSKPRPTSPSKSSTTSKSVAPLDGVLACTLLNEADRAQLAVTAVQKEKDLGDRRSCTFNENTFIVGVTLYDNADFESIKAVRKDARALPPVGKHQALQGSLGSVCSVTLQVTETSLAEGSVGGDHPQKCELALKVAQLIEPKLP